MPLPVCHAGNLDDVSESDVNQSAEQPFLDGQSEASEGDRQVTKGTLARDVALYSLARLLLVVAIVGVIMGGAALVGVTVPLIVAAFFSVLIALPLSLVLFKKLRLRVNESIAVIDEKRRADREQLRSRLRGENS